MSFSYCRTGPAVKQEFSRFSDDFYLDKEGVLVKKDIPKDDQALVESYFGDRLEAILDKYSDVIASMFSYSHAIQFTDEVVDIDNRKSDLDQILAVDQMLDDYRASDPALLGLSREDLVSHLQTTYKASVDAYNKKINFKEDSTNETKEIVQEGE